MLDLSIGQSCYWCYEPRAGYCQPHYVPAVVVRIGLAVQKTDGTWVPKFVTPAHIRLVTVKEVS